MPGDWRALQATLTDAGRQAAIAFHAEMNAELGHLTSPLAPHDREHFRSNMAEIIARCRTHQPQIIANLPDPSTGAEAIAATI